MARFMRTSCEFIDLVRQDVFPPEATPLLDQFCEFINSEHVWNLAQMVMPEFRSAAILPEERVPSPCYKPGLPLIGTPEIGPAWITSFANSAFPPYFLCLDLRETS